MQLSQSLKQYILTFANLYHQYKINSERFSKTKYFICSSLDYYRTTGLIQLSYNDKPGDLLPPMDIVSIKKNINLLSGLHPVDVNSINDLFYISQDKIKSLIINDDFIQVSNQSGIVKRYSTEETFIESNLISQRIPYLIGYIQAEKITRNVYNTHSEKYRLVGDHITTLSIMDLETKALFLKKPTDILFSNDYQYFSKEDVGRIGYICGQMGMLNQSLR